jgi:transposase
MSTNARPHRAQIVQHFLQQEAVQTIPWPAMSPDMNPIEHVWDFIGRKINQRKLACQPTHDCQNGGLHVEQAHCHGIFGLSDYHQERTSPTYHVTELHNKRGGYTRY